MNKPTQKKPQFKMKDSYNANTPSIEYDLEEEIEEIIKEDVTENKTVNRDSIFDRLNFETNWEEIDEYSVIRMKGFDKFKVFLDTFNDFVCEKELRYFLTIEPDESFELIKKTVGCELHYYGNGRYYSKVNDSVLIIFSCGGGGGGKTHISIDFYGENEKDTVGIWDFVYDAIDPYILDEEYVNLRWLYKDKRGDVNSHNFQHNYKDVILPEAYPFIENLDEYVKDFVNGDETLLIFQGIPGTGKTRLIRHLLREMSRFYKNEKHNDCYFGFTNNPDLINNEEFYMQFLLDDNYVGMILEDSDVNIKARKGLGDNTTINKLLFASDGFIPHNKKIILSTNLDADNIDDAIIRSGRCYDFVQTRKLTVPEANNFLVAYSNKFQKKLNGVQFTKDIALCDIYRSIKEAEKK